MFTIDKDVALLIMNAILAIGGFVIAFMINTLNARLKSMEATDKRIEATQTLHREDVLKNYVSTSDLESLKKDIIDRIDRFEDLILSIKRG